jgi:hypothetical protein
LPGVSVFPLCVTIPDLHGEALFVSEPFKGARLFAMIFHENNATQASGTGALR